MSVFDTWGKWFRVHLSITLFAGLVYYAPDFLRRLIEFGGLISELFK